MAPLNPDPDVDPNRVSSVNTALTPSTSLPQLSS